MTKGSNMTNEKHTPGPWDYTGPRKRIWTRKNADGSADDLRTVYCIDAKGLDHSPYSDGNVGFANTFADALVMAMAPELFKLLKEFTAPFVDIDTSGWWCPGCGPTDCTYEGDCTKCGFSIENIQPSLELIVQAQSIIAEVRGEAT